MICLLLKQLLKISNLVSPVYSSNCAISAKRLEFVCRHVLTIAPLSLLLLFVREKKKGKKRDVEEEKKREKCCITTQKVWCREISKEEVVFFVKDRIRFFLIKGNKWKIKKKMEKTSLIYLCR